ncbi:hypothetical protein KQX54_020913 [Cotesia glomerata]|uniref:Uncharacterized protein n=1 Tax=Cotesia glomerata TaxID=32391 RepID=A0AAV7J641_COTGL|nr:hypothetical protein KQX54_020913 [Cotesia glomerata]
MKWPEYEEPYAGSRSLKLTRVASRHCLTRGLSAYLRLLPASWIISTREQLIGGASEWTNKLMKMGEKQEHECSKKTIQKRTIRITAIEFACVAYNLQPSCEIQASLREKRILFPQLHLAFYFPAT